ncbi:MAG: hypothetical protein JHC87_07325, partial [Thermoleophilaceae bacterium]|nr:hypothetical protein [Thermoleophilaceae bacterium]
MNGPAVHTRPWRVFSGTALFVILVLGSGAGAMSATAAELKAVGAPTGGANIVTVPQIAEISCVAKCARRGAAQGGSTIRITGSELDAVTSIVFTGTRGTQDDVTAKVAKARAKRATVRVPAGAPSGAVVAATAYGVNSKPSRPLQILPPPPITASPDLQPLRVISALVNDGAGIETGTSTPRVLFVGSGQQMKYSLRVHGMGDVTANITLVR